MMENSARMPVDSNVNTIFADDGRVFYSLDSLIEILSEGVERRAHAARLINDPVAISFSDGEAMALGFIRSQRDRLAVLNIAAD